MPPRSLWLQKLVLMDFCVYHYCPEKKRKHRIWWAYRSVFFVAWPVSQVVGFTKCDPFHLYWQGVPAPGMLSCRSDHRQPLTQYIRQVRRSTGAAHHPGCDQYRKLWE